MKLSFKFVLFWVILSTILSNCYGQEAEYTAPSIQERPDSTKVLSLLANAQKYYFAKPDSSLIFSRQALALAQKIGFKKGEKQALNMSGEALRFLGEFPQALEMQLKAREINKENGDRFGEANTLGFIGFVYADLMEYREALNYLNQANTIYQDFSDPIMISFNLSNIGNAYEGLKMMDSALIFQKKAEEKSAQLKMTELGNLKILIATRLGIVHTDLNHRDLALNYFQYALKNSQLINDKVNPSRIQYQIAEIYHSIHKNDSSLYYAHSAYLSGNQIFQKLEVLQASKLLVELYKEFNLPDSVIHYQDIAMAMNDSMFGPKKLRQLQLLVLKDEKNKQELLRQQDAYKNQTKILSLLAVLILFLIIAIALYRNNRHKQKLNLILQHQKNEIQQTLTVLKTTQAQLIQSEKMASLGELTAGIAHEIQNPLNFVNNFSELNTELLLELNEEAAQGNLAEVKDLAKDIRANEEKINHHGKRADAIVKGMLQHSRSTSGTKEPTDINALADEYLRLAYHGLRAKDKGFNATMKTDFDPMVGNVNIVPQDMGRVILNLITNAFYAVNERKHQHPEGYEPTVSVSTKKIDGKIEISVKDNGNGIPQKILDKIFQPFFTTKPTGQGTGLGLSLAYDIVTKGHGGTLEVISAEGVGCEFIITLTKTIV